MVQSLAVEGENQLLLRDDDEDPTQLMGASLDLARTKAGKEGGEGNYKKEEQYPTISRKLNTHSSNGFVLNRKNYILIF